MMGLNSLNTLKAGQAGGSLLRRRRREGAVILEVAIVCPLVFLLIIGITVCGIASFRKHQVTALSGEAARWAAINAKSYAKANKGSMPSSDVIYTKAIEPFASSLDSEKLNYNVEWDTYGQTVSVSVVYEILPRFFGKAMTAQSKATYSVVQ